MDDVEPPSRPMTARTTSPGSNVAGSNFGIVYVAELVELVGVFASGGPAVSPRRALRPVVMYSRSAVDVGEDADVLLLVQAVEHRAERRVVLRVLRDEDQLLDRHVLRVVVAALVPRLRDAQAPALLQERQVRVRAAEQQHAVLERAAAREHARGSAGRSRRPASRGPRSTGCRS